MELRGEDLQLKLLEQQLEPPAQKLETDPVGALRPAWQLIAPSYQGLEDGEAQGNFSFGFCATLKETHWYARCDGPADQKPAPLQVTAARSAPDGPWRITLEGEVALEDWRGQTSHLALKTVHEVQPRPVDLHPEPWWRGVSRALTVDWLDRVDKARGGQEPQGLRWAEPRHDPPLYPAPDARHLASFVHGKQAWHVMSDRELVYLHKFNSRSIPAAQVLQQGPDNLASPPRAALSHDGQKLLLASQGARELDPVSGGRDKLKPLTASCQGQPPSCYGVTLLTADAKGRILLAGRAPEASLQSAPLGWPADSALVVVKDAKGHSELLHFARGGLLKNRWALPAHSPPGSLTLAPLDEHTVLIGPLRVGDKTQLLWLDTRDAKNKPQRSQPLPGLPLEAAALADGQGGALVITAPADGQGPLLHSRIDAKGKVLWTRPLPGGGATASQSLHQGQLWVHSASWSLLAPLEGGEPLYEGAGATGLPLWLPEGGLVLCQDQGLQWLDAQGKAQRSLPLAWSCGALGLVEEGELLVASGHPGGAYRVAAPREWKAAP